MILTTLSEKAGIRHIHHPVLFSPLLLEVCDQQMEENPGFGIPVILDFLTSQARVQHPGTQDGFSHLYVKKKGQDSSLKIPLSSEAEVYKG